MHALTIRYDIMYVCMYAQEVMRAEGLKEWPTQLFCTAINNYYSHTDWHIIIYIQ